MTELVSIEKRSRCLVEVFDTLQEIPATYRLLLLLLLFMKLLEI